jgi:HlyD family secretion protein/adhesin transport system membrane fusion protein
MNKKIEKNKPDTKKSSATNLAKNLVTSASDIFKRNKNKFVSKKTELPTSYYAHFLSRAILLEEAGPPRAVQTSILIICAFVLGGIAWAALTPLNETSVAQGEIVPASSVQPIQHLEGGIVAEVLVSGGQIVKKGDVILRLAPTARASELSRANAKYAALDMQIMRLKAFALNKTPDFEKYEKRYKNLADDQKDILIQQNRSKKAQIYVLKAQITEQYNEMSVLNRQYETHEKSVTFTMAQMNIRAKLQKKGLGSSLHLLEAQREYNKALGNLQETKARKASGRALIRKAEGNLIQLKAKLQDESFKQMGELSKELAQVMEEINILNDRVVRLEILSPADGAIKGLKYRAVGAVIPPGDVIAEVVPIIGPLNAEVRISPRDIGHIKLDSEVLIKIDTYNFNRYGGIKGKLQRISASSYMNEKGETYFKGIIELPSNFIGSNPKNNRITPGMTVVADIKTGEKTLLQYLVKPINNALDSSFRER